jgi:predicted ATPase
MLEGGSLGQMLAALAAGNYRSLRELVLSLGTLNAVSGENGSEKSSLYRALGLLSDTAEGRMAASLAQDGSARLWPSR